MKVVILCGGLGTRISEETKIKPKPMVKVGKYPIIEHIINIYVKNGFKDFILATGYKSQIIKNYFSKKKIKGTNIKTVFTGKYTLTGGRLKRLKKYFDKNEKFMVTYGDGLSNVNIKKLVKFHVKHKKIATMTVIHPPARFGEVILNNNDFLVKFEEKPQINQGWINGGFFVFNYEIFKYIKGDNVMLEKQPIQSLVRRKQIKVFKHHGFWKCMDTLRDKIQLNTMLKKNNAPWQ